MNTILRISVSFLFAVFALHAKAQIADTVASNDTLTKYVKYYSNGQKMIEYYYNNKGQKYNLETLWFSNGNLRSKTFYKHNDVCGKVLEWYKNGQLKFKGEKDNNSRENLCAEYYKNGQEKYKATYFKDYPMGKTIQYFPNGNKQIQTNIKFIKNNKYIKNNHTRIIINKVDTFTFKNVSPRITWYKNGSRKEKVYYSFRGINNYSKTKKWYENGQRKQKGSFRQKRGVYKEWYENGQLKLKCRNKRHFLNGVSQFWYENGQISTITNYKNGQVIESNDWDKSGNHIKQFIKTDTLQTIKKWDSKGNLIEQKKWNKSWIPLR